MNNEEFAKKYGFGTFKEGLVSTLDYTLDQLEFTEAEKKEEVIRLESIVKEYEQKVIDRFKDKFPAEEIELIVKYLSQETPSYMTKFGEIHAQMNDEFGIAILERLEEEEDEEDDEE